MIRSGWSITATWPMRSEMPSRMIASGTNALASSIVLSLRPRPEGAPITDRRSFLSELRLTLPDALRNLQKGNVAPVDLAQASIGPGNGDILEVLDEWSSHRARRSVCGTLCAHQHSARRGAFSAGGRLRQRHSLVRPWFEAHGFHTAPMARLKPCERQELVRCRAGALRRARFRGRKTKLLRT